MRQNQADAEREKAAKNIPISGPGGLVFPAEEFGLETLKPISPVGRLHPKRQHGVFWAHQVKPYWSWQTHQLQLRRL